MGKYTLSENYHYLNPLKVNSGVCQNLHDLFQADGLKLSHLQWTLSHCLACCLFCVLLCTIMKAKKIVFEYNIMETVKVIDESNLVTK